MRGTDKSRWPEGLWHPINPTVRRYLDDVPTEDEIRAVLARLALEPWDRWIAALAAHPKLIQRPIITADDGTAVIARTDEAVRDALACMR
ncbi:ArsC/Spx/MgsR family protein [Streptomyces sp. O3]